MSTPPPPPPPPPPPGPPGWYPPAGGYQQPGSSQPGYPQPAYGPPGYPPAPAYGTLSAGYGAPGGYAGFWPRLGGLIIDRLVYAVFMVPGIVLFVVSAATGTDGSCAFNPSIDSSSGDNLTRTCRHLNGGVLALAGLALVAGAVVGAIYFCRRLGRTGLTPGGKVAGIRVVDAQTGNPIGAGRALGRYLFAGFISGWFFFLGYLWMLWDKRHQTWHDKVVGSVVVKA